MASNALNQLISDGDWGELDYLFVDLPPGTGDVQLTLCQRTHLTGALVVSTPQDVALLNASEQHLNAYFSARHEATKATTANRRLTVFKRFFRWALRENRIADDPTLKLQSARQALRVPKTLTEAQVEALIAQLEEEIHVFSKDD